jgi:hypothetical protein
MFAKIAKFRAVSSWRPAPSPVTPTYSNDNRTDTRGRRGSVPDRHPILVCRWRPIIGGGLECHWNIESADGSATEEPDGPWLMGRICRLLGIEPTDGRLATPATG